MEPWSRVLERIAEIQGKPLVLTGTRTVGGGCINGAVVLETRHASYFVKHNDAERLDMFAAEAEGLETLRASQTVRVPAPVCRGTVGDIAFLALEYLPLTTASATVQEKLGRGLAALHRVTQPRYGWHRDNTIGSTPQRNTESTTWAEFFRDRRLGYQLGLAARHGHRRLHAKGERLLERLPVFFESHSCQPSLLHGDLWSGNTGATDAGEPVLYDPAVYFGDRETDIAMTELFGGFAPSFYAAYREAWPLAEGYETRRTLYNLYHILNHLNLFGAGYLRQAEQMLDRLLAEAG